MAKESPRTCDGNVRRRKAKWFRIAQTGHPDAGPEQAHVWMRSTPSALRSDLLAGRDQDTVAGRSAEASVMRTRQAREVANSTSRAKNHEPTMIVIIGSMGPLAAHGCIPLGSSHSRFIGKPMLLAPGSMPHSA